MNTISDYFAHSELSLAAYATLAPGIIDPRELEKDTVGMSPTQAAEFASRWRVVDQFTSSGLGGSGFSATVFESISGPNAGQHYLAIRGTESSSVLDLIADADLALVNGVAARQTVDLYNYYQRLTAPKGQSVAQLEWTGQSYVLSTATGATGLLDTPLSAPISVTGHSLGGHLAMVFGRLFPGAAGEILTYNAPGFHDAPANEFFARIDAALGRSGSAFQDVRTTNLHGSGLNIIAGFADDHGIAQEIFLEGNAHSIIDLTDALAVYDLLAQLDPDVDLDAISEILQAASATDNSSLEATIAAVGLLFGEQFPSTETIRDTLYQNIQKLTDENVLFRQATGLVSIESLTDKNSIDLTYGVINTGKARRQSVRMAA